MLKSTLIFVNLIFIGALFLASCSGKEMPKKEGKKQETVDQEEQSYSTDTVWVVDEFTDGQVNSSQLDTSVFMDGKTIDFSLKVVPVKDKFKVQRLIETGDSIKGERYIGPDAKVLIEFKDALNNVVRTTEFNKEELIGSENVGHIIAESELSFEFLGYHPQFEAILLRMYPGYPDSDDVLEDYLFIDRSGKIKMHFTNDPIFDGCDCEPVPSEDGRTFSFCKGILRSDYRFVDIEKEDAGLAGIFQIDNKMSVAIYTYDGKPPYSNGVVLDRSGRKIKQFSFEGISGAVSYQIPHFRMVDKKTLILVDEIEDRLLLFENGNEGDFTEEKISELPEATASVVDEGVLHLVYTLRGKFLIYEFQSQLYLKRN